jgi:hypothetical protein
LGEVSLNPHELTVIPAGPAAIVGWAEAEAGVAGVAGVVVAVACAGAGVAGAAVA